MEKTSLDTLPISRMGLGCMGMSEFYGPTDDRESIKTLHTAQDLGMNFFDTADVYGCGHNEKLLARAFRSLKEVVIASKFGVLRDRRGQFTGLDGRPDYVHQACDASLERLGRESLDLYYAHRIDPAVPIEDTVGAMGELVAAGKVRYLGLCEVNAEELQRAYRIHPITAVQSEYSLWKRDVEKTVLPACRELGIRFIAYSPLGRGFLAGNILSPDHLVTDDWRRKDPRFQQPVIANNIADYLHPLTELARKKGATSAQIALAWLLHQDDSVIPIPGTRNPDRLLENIEANRLTLTTGERDWLRQQSPETTSAATEH